MADQIEIEIAQAGKKVKVSVTQTAGCIVAQVGDLTFDGDVDLFGDNGLNEQVTAAVQAALSSTLPVSLKFGNITCKGSLSF